MIFSNFSPHLTLLETHPATHRLQQQKTITETLQNLCREKWDRIKKCSAKINTGHTSLACLNSARQNLRWHLKYIKCAGQFSHKGIEAINEAGEPRQHAEPSLCNLPLGFVFHFVEFFSFFERGGFEIYRIVHKILFLNQAALWEQK